MFTTGTTGVSKGIELAHKNVVAVAENVIDGVEMEKDNVELIPVPLSHSHGLRRYYANMLMGSSLETKMYYILHLLFSMMKHY